MLSVMFNIYWEGSGRYAIIKKFLIILIDIRSI